MSKPYKEEIKNGIKYREFDHMVETDELVWHRDKRDRKVTVLEGEGWFFQMDNDIPRPMKEGEEFFVPKEEYHRIYKQGTTPLKISIKETYMQTFKEFAELEEAKRMKYDKVIKKLRDGEWDTSMDVKKRMHLTYTDNNTGKEKVVFVESNDLEEGYAIDLNSWKLSHGGQSPKGKGTWAFDYKVSVDSGGMIGLQQDTFFSKAMSTYKDAVKQLTKFLKKEFKAKPKDVKIKLAP
jgi:mannose-6-phosphate isomerase-like protein (cupin superfamily)